jgi:hypothetical protein
MFPVNRLAEYFTELEESPEEPVYWIKVAENQYVTQALGLILTLRYQDGRWIWAIVKESTEPFADEGAAAEGLVAELRRSHVFLRHEGLTGQ